MDRGAQVLVMEIITAGIIMMSAMNFIASLNLPAPDEFSTTRQYTVLGEDALRNLERTDAAQQGYSNLLDQQMCTNQASQTGASVRAALDGANFAEINFRIFLDAPNPDSTSESIERILVFGSEDRAAVSDVSVGHVVIYISQDGSIKDLSTNQFHELEPGVHQLTIELWMEPT